MLGLLYQCCFHCSIHAAMSGKSVLLQSVYGIVCTDKNIVLWIPVNKCNYTCHSGRLNGLFFLKIKTVEVHSWGENKG